LKNLNIKLMKKSRRIRSIRIDSAGRTLGLLDKRIVQVKIRPWRVRKKTDRI